MDSRFITLDRNRQGQALDMTEGETGGRRPHRQRGRGEEDGFPLETGGHDKRGRPAGMTERSLTGWRQPVHQGPDARLGFWIMRRPI